MPCLRFPSISLRGKKIPSNVAASNDVSYDEDSDFEGETASQHGAAGPERLFASELDVADKLVGVLVTIASGGSYDEMFRRNKATTVPGERISTYFLACEDVAELRRYLCGGGTPAANSAWKNLVDDINHVQPDSVTFNWECCGGCASETFPGPRRGTQSRFGMSFSQSNPTMSMIGLALKRGFTVMCSDFSLKALIAQWSVAELGPNPFVKMGSCSHCFKLEFEPSELQNEEVPQQLQIVGELCAEEGAASVQAMGNTIVYTVNPRRSPTSLYTLKVLTVVTSIDGSRVSGSYHDGLDTDTVPNEGNTEQEDQNSIQCLWREGSPTYPEAMMCSVGSGEKEKNWLGRTRDIDLCIWRSVGDQHGPLDRANSHKCVGG